MFPWTGIYNVLFSLALFVELPDQRRRVISSTPPSSKTCKLLLFHFHNTCFQLSQPVHAKYLEFCSFLFGNPVYPGTGILIKTPASLYYLYIRNKINGTESSKTFNPKFIPIPWTSSCILPSG